MSRVTEEEEQRLEFEKLISILELVGLEPKKYSGRGMRGKHCVAVHTDGDNATKVSIDIMSALATDGLNPQGSFTPLQACELIEWISNEAGVPREDSLGHGRVVYWSTVYWFDASSEDDDSEEVKRADHMYDQMKDEALFHNR